MALKPIVQDSPALRALVTLNGRTRCNLVLRLKDAADDAAPLAADNLNVNAEADRRALLERLAPELREEAGGLLLRVAEEIMVERVKASRATARHSAPTDDEEDAEVRPPQFSDDALALAFTERHQDVARFTAAWNQWTTWDGTRWAKDHTLGIYDAIRQVNREISATCGNPKVRTIIASAKTVAAVERLARADRAHAATVEQWDRDPWILNTPDGVVDLRTGELRAPSREDYCTKRTAVAPGGDCPQWLEFLRWATGGDWELQTFLQRMAGYCLTGVTEEHALFFLYGTGGNGKGTFLNTLTGILGDYATVSPIDTFTASHGDRHPTELALLRGARLVTAQETEEGRRWAESRVKALTGGDPITARFMRGDFFTYVPQFKLVIAGNHRPGLRSVDEAMRRRFHLLPFEQTITAAARDPQLPEKLRAEWPGILAWMVEGCLMWLEMGLRPPKSVQAATSEYLEAEDSVAAWMEECCERRSTHWTSSAELYESWKAWAERAGERPGTQRSFSTALQTRGLEPAKSGHAKTRGFAGISLKRDTRHAYLAS